MIDLAPFPLSILVYVLIFLGVLLAYEGLQQLFFLKETQGEARNRRMKMIQHGASTDQVLDLLRDPAMTDPDARAGLVTRLRRLMVQAGVTLSPIWLLAGAVGLGGLAFAVATRFVPQHLALPISTVLALAVPYLALSAMKEARLKKLTQQLPDALDLMARGLKVGHPVAVTVGHVATDMPDPIGTEFGLIQDQINYGDDVATAFHDFARRVDTEDANYLSVSIGIQHGTGGNLARILNVLSQVIRDRHTMRKKIKAISAEGRLSGLILTLLPIAIYLSIELTTPSFYGEVRDDPWYPVFLYVVIGLTVAQGLILHRLVKFKF